MHLLLVAFLTVGLNWKSRTPAGLEAEIWDNVPVIKSVSQAVEQKMDADEKADIAMKKKKQLKQQWMVLGLLATMALCLVIALILILTRGA